MMDHMAQMHAMMQRMMAMHGSEGMMGQGMHGQGMPMMGGMMGSGTAPMMQGQGGSGMMGQGMMGGVGMPGGMGGMMAAGPAMIGQLSDEQVQDHLAVLKARLDISEAQEVAWDSFADAARSAVGTIREASAAPSMVDGDVTVPVRLDQAQRSLTARLDAIRTLDEGVGALYAVLNDEQRRTAERLLSMPLAMIAMR